MIVDIKAIEAAALVACASADIPYSSDSDSPEAQESGYVLVETTKGLFWRDLITWRTVFRNATGLSWSPGLVSRVIEATKKGA